MGGKSRKTGRVSSKLIAKLKARRAGRKSGVPSKPKKERKSGPKFF